MPNRGTKFPVTPFAAFAVIVIAILGGLLGHVVGTPKTFFLVVTVMAAWLIAGWFFGGWRAILVGISALSAALFAAEGTFAICALFLCISFFLLFADISPRERGHDDGIHSKI
jgi:hypothetical protein